MNSDAGAERIARALFPKHAPRALLLCAGAPPPAATLALWLAEADLFVCTDAAGRPYESLPRRPDLVVGDFDTLGDPAPTDEGGTRFLLREDQSRTDAEKALAQISQEGFGEAVLLGARGGRLDHSVHNLSLLESFAGVLRICLADEYGVTVRLAPGRPAFFALPVGTLFSLLALAGRARGVGLGGAEFPLADATLRFGREASVSNRVAASPLRVELAEGSLLLSAALSEMPPGAAG